MAKAMIIFEDTPNSEDGKTIKMEFAVEGVQMEDADSSDAVLAALHFVEVITSIVEDAQAQ